MTEQRTQIAKPDIIEVFESRAEKVLTRSDIESILETHRRFWRLRRTMPVEEFIDFLLQKAKLRKVTLDFPNRKTVRYTWRKRPVYEVLMTIHENCYLSHYTALHVHGLTQQVPKTIYVNWEQAAKRSIQTDLTQDRIDAAFRRPTRVSRNFTEYENHRIYLLSGKHTGNLGVVEAEGPSGELLRVTGVERTLIDISVRPEYAGGVFEVLRAYRSARSQVSVNKLAATLKKLDYIYPYHQAIGFYLEQAGVYKQSSIGLLRKLEFKYDFYLMHQMREKQYSQRWRLYFPKGL